MSIQHPLEYCMGIQYHRGALFEGEFKAGSVVYATGVLYSSEYDVCVANSGANNNERGTTHATTGPAEH
jgi:hypothetical protein